MDEGLATRDVYITLAAIAQSTSRIQLGTGITNPYTRHPAVTAASIATLDELSGGRAMLGIGAGGSLTLDPLAIAHRKPATAVCEMIEATRLLFGGGAVDFDGESLQLKAARLEYARPDIEIWLAGRGPKMLELGGRLCDGVSLSFMHRDLIPDYLEQINNGALKSGNQPMISFATFVVTNPEMLERVKPYLTFALVDSPPKAKELIGISEPDVARIRAVMGSQGLTAAGALLKEEWLAPFVIMGDQAQCAAQLSDLLARYHFDELLLPLLDMDLALTQMSDLAEIMARIT